MRFSEDRTADLVRASGCGTVLTLLAMPEDRRDLGLLETARAAVIAAITTGLPALESPGPASAAIALRAVLPGRRHSPKVNAACLKSGSTASP